MFPVHSGIETGGAPRRSVQPPPEAGVRLCSKPPRPRCGKTNQRHVFHHAEENRFLLHSHNWGKTKIAKNKRTVELDNKTVALKTTIVFPLKSESKSTEI